MVESIEGESWYHGLRPKEDVVPLLKDVGDWLVRAIEGRISFTEEKNEFKIDIVLSVMIEAPNKIFNYLLNLNKTTNMWAIASTRHLREFATPLELIKYYEENDLPGGYRLLRAVPRPRWMINHSCVRFDEWDPIGRGYFCNVVKGKYNDPFKRVTIDVAIKVWHDGKDSTRSKREEARNCMMKEAKIMMRYKHRNVVRFYGVACDRPPVMIVMELCPGGNLEMHLRKMYGAIMVGERIVYCLEIARGIRYLHNKNCIHGDLACRNCLISKHGEIKITDFGLSKLVDEITTRTKKLQPQDHLPVRWMAPETLTRVPLYSTKSDVWSYGMVCYEIFNNGEKPWPYLEAKIIAKSYKNGKLPNIPSATPPQIAKMMTRTWHLKAENRPNFGEIIVTLTKAHCAIPPPPPEMLTVFSLEGVTRRTPEEIVRHHKKSNLPDAKTLSIEEKANTTISPPPSPPGNVAVTKTHASHKRLPICADYETLQSKPKPTRARARTKALLNLRTTEKDVTGSMFAKKHQPQLGNKRIRSKTVGRNQRFITTPLPRRMSTAISRN